MTVLDSFDYKGLHVEVINDYGIRWRIPAWDRVSSGCFYKCDMPCCETHQHHGYSLGAVIGHAGECCRRHIDRIRASIKENP